LIFFLSVSAATSSPGLKSSSSDKRVTGRAAMASKSRLRMNGCRARTKAGMLDGTHVARLKSSASAPLADGMCVRLRWGLSNLGLSVGNFTFRRVSNQRV
jgi:hypothetical protein